MPRMPSIKTLAGKQKAKPGGGVKTATRRQWARERSLPQGRFDFTLPYPPTANLYWRHVPYQNPQTGKWGVKVYVSERANQYKKVVRMEAARAGVQVLDGPTVLVLRVYRPRRSGDLGNSLKVLEDALNLVAWVDDSQTVKITMELDDSQPTNPRVEVTLYTRNMEPPLLEAEVCHALQPFDRMPVGVVGKIRRIFERHNSWQSWRGGSHGQTEEAQTTTGVGGG